MKRRQLFLGGRCHADRSTEEVFLLLLFLLSQTSLKKNDIHKRQKDGEYNFFLLKKLSRFFVVATLDFKLPVVVGDTKRPGDGGHVGRGRGGGEREPRSITKPVNSFFFFRGGGGGKKRHKGIKKRTKWERDVFLVRIVVLCTTSGFLHNKAFPKKSGMPTEHLESLSSLHTTPLGPRFIVLEGSDTTPNISLGCFGWSWWWRQFLSSPDRTSCLR